MDDKRIEEMLRESVKPEMPDGMRDRVLRAARRELARAAGRPILSRLRWRPLLAGAAAVILISTNVASYRVQSRLSKLTDGSSERISLPVGPSLLKQRREIADMLAQTPLDTRARQSKGDETL